MCSRLDLDLDGQAAVIHLGLVGLGLHRAVSKESTARQTLPPVKTFHKMFLKEHFMEISMEIEVELPLPVNRDF